MIKLIGLIMIAATGTLSGVYSSGKLSERVQFLEEYIEFIMFTETEIRYTGCHLPQIVSKYEGERSFGFCLRKCSEYMKSGENFSSAWKKVFNSKKNASEISDEQRKMITDFGQGLGTSDTEGQISHCRYHSELIRPQFKTAVEEKRVKGKLYMILGACSGIAIALLLI